jgi:hypothetical protein
MTLFTAQVRDVTRVGARVVEGGWETLRKHVWERGLGTNEQKSFQQYFYNRYKIVVYSGLRSNSIKNHASRNEARRLTCICLTAI